MPIVKKLLLWAVAFCVTSALVFTALYFVVPGFPFFPRTVYRTTSENSTTRLEAGGYYLLFFVQGQKKLSVLRGDVGPVAVMLVKADGTKGPVSLKPANFFFDDAPNANGTRGHAVDYFQLSTPHEIEISSTFKSYGYKGLLIRTGFRKMIVTMLIYEVFVLFLSVALTLAALKWYFSKRLTHSAVPHKR